MTASPGARRPLAVTVVVVLTALVAVLDLVVGVLVLAGADDIGPVSGMTADQSVASARVVAVVFLVFGLVQAVVAYQLAKGSNGARLVLSLVLVAQQLHSLYLGAQLDIQRVPGFAGLAIAVVILFLIWNPVSSAWFDRGRNHALADSIDTGGAERQPSGTRVIDFLVRLVVLGATIALMPGVTTDSPGSLILAVVMVSIAGWLLQPLFMRVALHFGWIGAVLLALFANAVVLGLGLYLTPGVTVSSPVVAFFAAWVYAFVMTLISWAFSINSRDYLTVHAMRMGARGVQEAESDIPGVVFVQLDGVPAPLLESEIRSGNIPTISRWVRSGSHTWTEWTARVPSTTPVSQAGLLHGNNAGIPAFRWYDREMGRLLVANRPEDAAIIEARVGNGRGLLADDGVSISNLFSGDAATSLLTMSGLKEGKKGLGPSQSYAAFFTHPAGILRAVILTIGEMAKEVFQARRQVRRGVEPRIHRGGAYVALRAVTNVFLRDLNVALVVEAMMKGSKSIYVDFVDYDEIAHHAGVTRSESLAAFYGLDDVLRSIEQVIDAGITPRPYHVVLVSDHGQSQGATFLQRYGVSLEGLILDYFKGSGHGHRGHRGGRGLGPGQHAHRAAVRAGLGLGAAHQAGHLRPRPGGAGRPVGRHGGHLGAGGRTGRDHRGRVGQPGRGVVQPAARAADAGRHRDAAPRAAGHARGAPRHRLRRGRDRPRPGGPGRRRHPRPHHRRGRRRGPARPLRARCGGRLHPRVVVPERA